MLTIKNLSNRFGETQAINDLSFNVYPGQVTGLIGQNGAGKTTAFHSILNFLNYSGEILWNDQPITENTLDEIGYLPEERSLLQKMTIEQHILYLAKLKGKRAQAIKPLINEWLEKFQVKGGRKDLIKSLSKGNQQKVQLICTLIYQPKLIILDEPFSGLDPVNAGLLEEGIRKARDRGASIIFSSHNMNNVEELCDNLVMLKDGRQVLYGTIREIRERFGRTRLFLESSLSKEEIESIDGVKSVSGVEEGIYHIQLRDAEVGHQIFDLATQDGYIPTFSQQP